MRAFSFKRLAEPARARRRGALEVGELRMRTSSLASQQLNPNSG